MRTAVETRSEKCGRSLSISRLRRRPRWFRSLSCHLVRGAKRAEHFREDIRIPRLRCQRCRRLHSGAAGRVVPRFAIFGLYLGRSAWWKWGHRTERASLAKKEAEA